MGTLLALLACAPDPRALAPGEPPDLVLVEVHGPMGPAPGGSVAFPVAAASPASLLATPDGETLPGVLARYGWHTAVASDVGVPGFAEVAGPGWLDAAPEPFLWVDRVPGDAAAAHFADVTARLRARGLVDRTAVVYVGTDGWTSPSSAWWAGPGAPPPPRGDSIASVADLLPTLLALAGATVPAGAHGVDLAYGAGPMAFAEGADGTGVARTATRRLAVAARAELPEACPSDAVLTDADGAPVDDPAARAALWAGLRAWRARRSAREGADYGGFRRLEESQGYWR